MVKCLRQAACDWRTDAWDPIGLPQEPSRTLRNLPHRNHDRHDNMSIAQANRVPCAGGKRVASVSVADLRWSSSVVEHVLGKDGVTGSIPVSSFGNR